jgi:hypothetical protein
MKAFALRSISSSDTCRMVRDANHGV